MAFKTAQVAVSASTITDLLSGFSLVGNLADPLPVQFMITAGTVYWGGPTVSAANGFLMLANVPVVMNVYSNDRPFVFSTGTPTVYVAVGRQ